jgi:hypothetical protein
MLRVELKPAGQEPKTIMDGWHWPGLTLVAGFELGGGRFWDCVLKFFQQLKMTLSPKIAG